MKLALVHDYLSQDGGAERVLLALHELWPEAPIFVLFHDHNKINYLPLQNIHESFLAHLPFARSHYQWYLPWMPLATESHDLREYDVVISTSSIFAKGIITGDHTLHISYCHTPPRFLWSEAKSYVSDLKYNPLIKLALPNLIHRLRLWDRLSVDRVDHFVANSHTVAERIHKFYRRDSEVIYPPIAVERFHPSTTIGDYFLAGGRLVPYKRFDLLIKVCNRLRLPLKIFGTGPEFARLSRLAGSTVEMLGAISETKKAELMARARAFLHPQLEDFGITPVESMAAGRPVIAYGKGGATETIIPGVTGVFFTEQTWESLLDTLLHFDPFAWDSERIVAQAKRFDQLQFQEKIKQTVLERYEEFKRGLYQSALIA